MEGLAFFIRTMHQEVRAEGGVALGAEPWKLEP